MKFGILSIGNEVVKGRTVNTNASEIANFLIQNGHEVAYVVTCKDEPDDICNSLNFLLEYCQAVISSGGLGPTLDDITIQSISRCLKVKMEINEHAMKLIEEKYSSMNLPVSDERKKMAMMPEGSSTLENSVGTAPGMFLKHHEKMIFSIPGVPREMRGMLRGIVDITGEGSLKYISREVKIEGIMESTFAPYIKKISEEMKNKIYVKSHPESAEFSHPILIIEVYGYSDDEKDLDYTISKCLDQVRDYATKLNGKIVIS